MNTPPPLGGQGNQEVESSRDSDSWRGGEGLPQAGRPPLALHLYIGGGHQGAHQAPQPTPPSRASRRPSLSTRSDLVAPPQLGYCFSFS